MHGGTSLKRLLASWWHTFPFPCQDCRRSRKSSMNVTPPAKRYGVVLEQPGHVAPFSLGTCFHSCCLCFTYPCYSQLYTYYSHARSFVQMHLSHQSR